MLAISPVALQAGPLALRLWRPDDAAGFVARRADWRGGDHASWAVADGSDVVLGSVSLHSIDPVQGDAEIGYWTAPGARGQGVAAVAVDAACRWAFATLPVDRIELCHAAENAASGRVAEKAGFTLQGRLRRSYQYGDGRKDDELLWARLSDDPAPVVSIRS